MSFAVYDNPAPSAPVGVRPGRVQGTEVLGAAVRSRRSDAQLTLKQLADRAGTSTATVHGIESGQRSVSLALLQAIAEATDSDVAALFREAGVIPDQVSGDLLSQGLSGVMNGGNLRGEARVALRRVHLGVQVSRRVPNPPTNASVAVDIEGVLHRDLGIDFSPEPNGDGHARFASSEFFYYPSELDDENQHLMRRMKFAHMAGHAVLSLEHGRTPRCEERQGGSNEAEASWIAGHILLPRTTLISTFQLLAGKYNQDDPVQFGEMLSDVARRFDVPIWLATRHIADAGQILWSAGLDDL